MQSGSKIRMFWRLYRNELHKLLTEILILAILAVTVNLLSYFKVSGPAAREFGIVLGLLDLNLLVIVFLIPFLASFRILSQEWSHQSIYLLLSLPVSGGVVLGAKLAALFSQLLIDILTVGICGGILSFVKIPPNQWQLLHNALYDPRMNWLLFFLLACITGMLVLLCISFFSQVAGKLCRKFSKLVTGLTFLATLYLTTRLHSLLSSLILQLHGIKSGLVVKAAHGAWTLNTLAPCQTPYMISYLLLDLLIAAALFAAAAILYDRKLEL